MQTHSKPVEFLGSALDDLRDFPLSARREAGYQIDKVQHGEEPDDWKPMKIIGAGVQEIRVQDEAGAFRVIYLAKLAGMASMSLLMMTRRARFPLPNPLPVGEGANESLREIHIKRCGLCAPLLSEKSAKNFCARCSACKQTV